MIRATVPTEEKAIVKLARSAGARVHVACEKGTQAQWLHDVLVGVAGRLCLAFRPESPKAWP